MKIGIVGAGISGLTAAYEASKKGHQVVVFEKEKKIGGLSRYFKIEENYLEEFYHHFFESDKDISRLAKELKIESKLKFYPASTGLFYDNQIYPLTTPSDFLRFPHLSLVEKLRGGFLIGFLKYFPFPLSFLDKISAKEFICRYAGKENYEKIWGPLVEGKFSSAAKTVPALWLWGRLRDRSFKLGYFEGSNKVLFDALLTFIKNSGNAVKIGSEVLSVTTNKSKVLVRVKEDEEIFDKVLITTVSPLAVKLIGNKLPSSYQRSLSGIQHLGVVCVVALLKSPLQSQYWLNIGDRRSPVVIVVEHTNLVDRRQYNNQSVVYLANYYRLEEKEFAASEKILLEKYLGFMKRLNKNFNRSWVNKSYLFRTDRAQTIFKTGAPRRPDLKLPLPNLYLANIDQMYPHDRNLNHGAKLGREAVEVMLKDG